MTHHDEDVRIVRRDLALFVCLPCAARQKVALTLARLVLILAPNDTRLWHRHLAERLTAAGHQVALCEGPPEPAAPLALRVLLGAEALVRRQHAPLMDDALALPLAPPAQVEGADIALDLTGRAPPAQAIVGWRLLFDGAPGRSAALGALLADRTPVLRLVDDAGAIVGEALTGIADRNWVGTAMSDLAAGIVALIEAALAQPVAALAAPPPPARPAAWPQAVARFALRRARQRLRAKDHWRIGWHRAPEVFAPEAAIDFSALTFLTDDGARFFADPILFRHAGETHVFCEEFPYSTNKGVISRFILGDDGRASPARPVLERPYHLSYPFLFAHEGEIYMLPETVQAGRIALYRADPFPDRFVFDRVLVPDVRCADPTLFAHQGQWWLFGALGGDFGPDWSRPVRWRASSPFGPFERCDPSPLRMDARFARPAGPLFEAGGRLFRPVQDCAERYGGAVRFLELDHLSPHGLAERPCGAITPPLDWRGAHTFQRAFGWHIVDGVFSRGAR